MTNNYYGTANFFVNDYLNKYQDKIPDVYQIKAVIVVEKTSRLTSKKKLRRLVKKVRKIGIFGVVTGIFLRKYYDKRNFRSCVDTIDTLCNRSNITLERFDSYNNRELVDYLVNEKFDLGISLGNSYIPEKLFIVPRNGMLNIHHELLPDLPNAQSVIWSIYHRRVYSGLTLHSVSKEIDKGKIHALRRVDLERQSRFGRTIIHNYERLVLESFSLFDEYIRGSVSAEEGSYIKKHTTPSLLELIQIYLVWRQLLKIK